MSNKNTGSNKGASPSETTSNATDAPLSPRTEEPRSPTLKPNGEYDEFNRKLDNLTKLLINLSDRVNQISQQPSSNSGFHLEAPPSAKGSNKSKSPNSSKSNSNPTDVKSANLLAAPANFDGTSSLTSEVDASTIEISSHSHIEQSERSQPKPRNGVQKGNSKRSLTSNDRRVSASSIDINDMVEEEVANSVIKLNVGGKLFCTTQATLSSVRGSMFEALISGRHSLVRDAEGAIFLDRDPDTFETVLTYLRDPRQLDLRFYTPQQQQRILCELDYFMIPYEKVTRPLPANVSGRILTVERENQWNFLKWPTRATHHIPGRTAEFPVGEVPSSSSTNMLALNSNANIANQQQKAKDFGAEWPQIKFASGLVYLNVKGRPLRAYDLWTGQCLTLFKDAYCDNFAVTDDQLVTYDSEAETLRLWNPVTTAGVAFIKSDQPPTNITHLSFINNSMLVLGGESNKCVTLNLQIPDQATTTVVLQGANSKQIEPYSDSVVAVGSTNGNIILWNVKLNVLLGTIPTAQQRIRRIFARSSLIYCLSADSIKVWNCSLQYSSKPVCITTIYDDVSCLDADGDLIAGITSDRSRMSLLKIWSLNSSSLVHVMPIPVAENVHTIKLEGNRLAMILDDGTVLTWAINLVY